MQAKFQRIKSDSVQLNSMPMQQKVDICKTLISQYGTLAPPVVGDIDGAKTLIYGDCELRAMIELNTDFAETMVVPLKDKAEANKLSLMLMEMKPSPDAVSEGALINELIGNGLYTQAQVASFLNKSVSWVNKRISLVTRLVPALREMVSQKRLSPQTAQEIAKLPEGTQYGFSSKVIDGRLPKSSVESLVSAYCRADCPDDFKKLILDDPSKAVGLLPEKTTRQKGGALHFKHGIQDGKNANQENKPGGQFSPNLEDAIMSLETSLTMVVNAVYQAEPSALMKNERTLKQLFVDANGLMKLIDKVFEEIYFPQGKAADNT